MMRVILLNWLLEVSSAFHLKRETYYLTLSTIDRVLSCMKASQSDLQLIGITCLYLSVKREEIYSYPIDEFSKTTSNTFTVTQIKQKESEILPKLKWQLYPATYYNWLNSLLKEWDYFLKSVFSETISQMTGCEERLARVLITFKEQNKNSYIRYIQSMELLDISTLDFSIHQYRPLYLIAAILYAMVYKWFILSNFELFPPIDFMPDMQEHQTLVETLLCKFLAGTVEIQSSEQIAAELRFIHCFDQFEFSSEFERFDNAEDYVRDMQVNYEEFLAVQTFNPRFLEFLQNEGNRVN
jgi:hypothetical protein